MQEWTVQDRKTRNQVHLVRNKKGKNKLITVVVDYLILQPIDHFVTVIQQVLIN